MAELHEVETVLAAIIAQAVYPDGTAAASATGTPARISRGWPVPADLDAALASGMALITVFPLDVERNVTRYPTDWQELPKPPVDLILTVSGNTVTVNGGITCPLNAAILVNGRAFVYPLQATDTLVSVATGLATIIGTATSQGRVITVPQGKVEARVGIVGNVIREIRRQKKSFRISLWCPTPAVRDAIARVVDDCLAPLEYVNLPDGTSGRLIYERTHTDDGGQKALRYRRDFVYSVEYATTETATASEIISSTANINQ